MNKNDLVYLYMFDLDVTLSTSTDLIYHRFGKIKNIRQIDIVSSRDKALMYEVELRVGTVVNVATYDTSWRIISLNDLKDKIETIVEIDDLKEHLLEQVNDYIDEQNEI